MATLPQEIRWEQCVSCHDWFPYDEMYYFITDCQWVCVGCTPMWNNW